MKRNLLLSLSLSLSVALSLAVIVPGAATAGVIAKGTFHNVGNEKGRGTVAVVTGKNGARLLKVSRNFAAFNGVSLRLWLATSPSAKRHLDLGKLNKFGAQTFKVPKKANLHRYTYVIAWCVEFHVPITQAILR